MKHRNGLAIAAALSGGLGLATAALAAPLTPAPLGAAADASIAPAAFGCGPGFHPNPWGLCRPNLYGPRPYFGPRRFFGPYGYARPRPYYRPYGFYGRRPYF